MIRFKSDHDKEGLLWKSLFFMKSNHPLLLYQHHVTGFNSVPQTNRLPFARNIEPPKPHIVPSHEMTRCKDIPSEVCTCDRAHTYYSHEMLRNKSKVVNTGNGHLSTNGLRAQRKCPPCPLSAIIQECQKLSHPTGTKPTSVL